MKTRLQYQPLLYLVGGDRVLAEFVLGTLRPAGYRIEWQRTFSGFSNQLSELSPDAILLAIDSAEDQQLAIEEVNRIRKEQIALPPVVFMSAHDDFDACSQAVRAGSSQYLVRPFEPEKLLSTVAGLVASQKQQDMRLLYIGQRKSHPDFFEALCAHDFSIVTLEDPREMFVTLRELDSEVVIIDYDGTDFSAVELATMIKQHEKFSHIAVLVPVESEDYPQREAILRIGAGILDLSVQTDLLMAYIRAKFRRGRWVRFLDNALNQAHKLNKQQQIALDQHAIVSITDASGNIIYANEKFCQISGYSQGDLIGHNHRIIKSGHHPAEYFHDLWETIIQGKVWHGEICNRARDGSEYWVESTIVPFIGDDGLPFQYISMNTDITALMRAQRSLVEAKEIAEQASRTKTEFLARMSHELLTPLNAILGFGQLMQSEEAVPLPDSHQENINEIMCAGQRLLEMINDVLNLAKIEAGRIEIDLEPVQLCSLLKDCISMIMPAAEQQHVSLHLRNTGGSGQGLIVRADPVRLKQILMNLLSNAIKYNHKSGKVDVYYDINDDSVVRISVADTGTGIEDGRYSELFDPYNRLAVESTDNNDVGMGLAVSKKFIEAMEGKIGYQSKVGEGSTFWVELPCEISEATVITRPENNIMTTMEDNSTGTETVLYIEDNPANLKLVDQLIERKEGIRLLTAHTPDLGVDMAMEYRPNLILLDINLPGGDGYQVLEKLRSFEGTRSIPVIAITANTMASDIEKGIAAGFKEYISKPIDVGEFYAMLERNL